MRYRYRNEEEMKDSGIEWIGWIPEKWKVLQHKYIMQKLKYICSVYKGEKILSLTKKGVIERDLESCKGKMPTSFDGYQYVYINNLLLCLFDIDVTPRCIGIIKSGGLVSPAYSQFKMINRNEANYYNYLLRKIDDEKSFLHLSKNLRNSLTESDFGMIKSVVPSEEEQRKIAKFLDGKTVEFDLIISKKEILIEKLEEAKKSLISEVVTGKVKVIKTNDGYKLVERKKEEMKDSGVEWIDSVPNEWDLKRSSYVLKFSKGLSITKENLQEEGIPCMNYGEIHSKYGFEVNPNKNNLKCVSDEYLKNNSNALITKGDFIFADTSEDIQGCGNFSYLNSNTNIFAGYHTIIARPIEKVNSRYLAYLFMSEEWRTQIRTKVSGVKVLSITQGILKNSKIILAGWEEEKDIVEYLDNKVSSANLIIDNVRKQIEKIKEAKQSLISEVVTGKIEILE